jgi:hypothetical protein
MEWVFPQFIALLHYRPLAFANLENFEIASREGLRREDGVNMERSGYLCPGKGVL